MSALAQLGARISTRRSMAWHRFKAALVPRLRLLVALTLVLGGVGLVCAGIAVLFWPAALMVAGIFFATVGALFVNVIGGGGGEVE